MGNPLRILHVVVNMNRGGAETLIMNLYRNVDRSKIQFDFLTCKEGIFDREIRDMGGKVYRIPYITDVGHQAFIQALNQFLKDVPYKIIHSHMDKMSGFVLRAAKQMQIPVRIAHSHNTESEGGLLAKVYKWYAGSFINKSATHFYACSEMAANWLFKNRRDSAYILKNGIELNKFQYSKHIREAVRHELGIDKDTFIFGHVGRFSHQKNHLFLLESYAKVKKQIPESKLLLVGDGPLRKSIEQKIQELHLNDSVQLLGVRDDIDQLLQAFDLFVFPSLHEGLPVTLIEAQGAGLPCLTSDRITTEVNMGVGLIHSLSIKDKDLWIKEMTRIVKEKHSRIVAEEALLQKGYDITKTAKQIEINYVTLGAGAR